MPAPSITAQRLRTIVSEELRRLGERVDHKGISSVVAVASKLMEAIESFKEKAPPAALNAVTPHVSALERSLEDMVSSPGSYVQVPRREPQRVSLKAAHAEGRVAESTGEAGPEPVDGDSWEHLEAGGTYRCSSGDDSTVATFDGWFGEDGQPTDVDDPKGVVLRFTDAADGFKWEAYWHVDRFCTGADADTLSVEEVDGPAGAQGAPPGPV